MYGCGRQYELGRVIRAQTVLAQTVLAPRSRAYNRVRSASAALPMPLQLFWPDNQLWYLVEIINVNAKTKQAK